MIQIDIRGVIVPDDDMWAYEWFGITATCPAFVRDLLKQANGEPVTVTVNSGGGDVTSGQEIYTILREYAGNVLIRIQSMAASATAVLSMARESEISPVAQLMVHNVSTRAEGDYHAMDHASEILRNSNRALAAAFTAKTGKSEQEILELMDRETWLTAQQAVEMGFVDRIMTFGENEKKPDLQLAASVGFGLLPEKAIAYAKANMHNQTAAAKARAEYDFMILEGKTK